jgi:hypothetical protein
MRPDMRPAITILIVGLAAYAVFVFVERAAAPTANENTGARYYLSGGKGGYTTANEACRNICEPHCATRWGTSSWAHIIREACFRSCVDVACTAQ